MYNDSQGFGGGSNDSIGGDEAATSKGGNYRKVFRPNIPPARSQQQIEPQDARDNVELANAMALGNYTPNHLRKEPKIGGSGGGGYEPDWREQEGANRSNRGDNFGGGARL